MFKKGCNTSNAHKVSGVDRKKLRKSLQSKFPALEEDVAALDAILPAKAGDVKIAKLSAPSRGFIYTLDDRPMLIDTSGKGDLVPTIYALWACPGLLPTLTVKHPAVSQYLIGGADLMVPGVAGFPSSLLQGGLVSVSVPDNPAPLAVGVAALSGAVATERAAAGGKGKAVEVLHVYGDCLWQTAKSTPNEGFLADVVMPLGWAQGEGEEAPSDGGGSHAEDGASNNDECESPPHERDDWEVVHHEDGELDIAGLRMSESECGELLSPPRVSMESAPATGAPPDWCDMDDLLLTCFLQALHKSVKDKALPLPAGQFWAQHVLPSRPPGAVLDIKKTSWKKLAKFLQAHGPGGTGLLSLSAPDKFSQEVSIQAVDREHDLYLGFRPLRRPTLEAVEADGGGGRPEDGHTEGDGGLPRELSITCALRPSKDTGAVIAACGGDSEAAIPPREARQAPHDYVAQEGLTQGAPSPAHVVLDVLLCDALYKGVLKRGDIFPSSLPKAELSDAFVKRMHPQWELRRGGAVKSRKGSIPPVEIKVVKRSGNKKLTTVQGMEWYLLPAEALASIFRKQFACSTAVSQLEGAHRKAQSEIKVQGDCALKLAAFLTSEYNVPKESVVVDMKNVVRKRL